MNRRSEGGATHKTAVRDEISIMKKNSCYSNDNNISPFVTSLNTRLSGCSAGDPLARDEIFGKGLRVVEDDKHGRPGDVVGHAVVPEGDAVRLLQRGRDHGVAPFGVVPRQHLRHEDVLVAVRARRRVLVLHRQRRVDGEVHALAIDGGCVGRERGRRRQGRTL